MTPENSPTNNLNSEGCFGKTQIDIASKLIDLVNLSPAHYGLENLNQASETIRRNGSVLIISNHPDTFQTIIIGNTIDLLLRQYGPHVVNTPISIIISDKFTHNQSGWYGPLIPHIIRRKGVNPIEVTQGYIETDESKRTFSNIAPIKMGLNILKNKGILAYYPEGTRSPQMKIKELGHAHFGSYADTIILQTTELGIIRPEVTYQSLPGKELLSYYKDRYGKLSSIIFEEVLLTLIASKLEKNENRGYYRNRLELVEYLESNNCNLDEVSDSNLSLFFPKPILDPEKPNQNSLALHTQLTPQIQKAIINETLSIIRNN